MTEGTNPGPDNAAAAEDDDEIEGNDNEAAPLPEIVSTIALVADTHGPGAEIPRGVTRQRFEEATEEEKWGAVANEDDDDDEEDEEEE